MTSVDPKTMRRRTSTTLPPSRCLSIWAYRSPGSTTRRGVVRGLPRPRWGGGGAGVLEVAMRAATYAGSLSEVNNGGRPAVRALKAAKNLGQRQLANAMRAEGSRGLTRQVQPVKNGLKLTLFHAADGPQPMAFNQHGQRRHKRLSLCSQGVKESAFVETEGMPTGRTVIPVFSVAMDFEVSATGLSKVGTRCVSAPLPGSVHCASPLSTRRCAKGILFRPFTA